MNIKKMCTSLAMGFYIRGEDEYVEFKHKMLALSRMDDSIFTVYEHKPIQIVNQQLSNAPMSQAEDEIEDDFVVI